MDKSSIVRYFRLERGYATGEFYKEYVQVRLSQRQFVFAKPAFSFPNFSAVSKDWIKKHKSDFYYLVGFIDGVRETPTIIGIIPFKNTSKQELYAANLHTSLYKDFKVVVNDEEDGNYTIEHIESGKKWSFSKEKTWIDSEEIHLGAENAKEPAVLGDTNESVLNEIHSLIQSLHTMLTTYFTAQVAISANPPFTPLAAAMTTSLTDLTTMIADLTSIKTKIPNTKSSVVKLN